MFFFEHESHESDESFSLRLKMNIRLIRDISVQLNICECIFFSNTNRTNLTNLLGCDPVCIRGIREITSLWSVGLRQISWSRTSRKRSRLQIRLKSLCIEKKQRSKKSVSKTPCASVIIREFFDLRSVAAGSQNEL